MDKSTAVGFSLRFRAFFAFRGLACCSRFGCQAGGFMGFGLRARIGGRRGGRVFWVCS